MMARIVVESFFGIDSSTLEIAGEPAPLFLQRLNYDLVKQAFSLRGMIFGAKSFEWGLTAKDKDINDRIKILKSIA